MITIVDYGMGNLGSLANMIKKVGGQSIITSDLDQILNATKLILPGVGSFDAAMEIINSTGLKEILDKKVETEKVPLLGVCLGMQLLTDGSEEGVLPGLGWIPGSATRIKLVTPNMKVPHMGWNEVRKVNSCIVTDSLPEDSKYYFVHSYAVQVKDQTHSILKTTHGIEFDSFICRDNIFGAQFHPEKSHRYGMALISAFVGL